MTTPVLDPMLIPVGLQLGALYEDGEEQPRRHVRIGARIFRLTREQATVWDLAHAPSDDRAEGLSARSLLAFAADQGLDLQVALDTMLELGLVAEVSMFGDAMVDFARTHAIAPLMTGLGNAPDRLGDFLFGVGEMGYALAGLPMYEAITSSGYYGSIWDLAEALAPALAEDLHSPEDVAAMIVRGIPSFLPPRVLYVDVAEVPET